MGVFTQLVIELPSTTHALLDTKSRVPPDQRVRDIIHRYDAVVTEYESRISELFSPQELRSLRALLAGTSLRDLLSPGPEVDAAQTASSILEKVWLLSIGEVVALLELIDQSPSVG